MQGIGKDHVRLGAEDDDQGKKKACRGYMVEFVDENLIQIPFAAVLHHQAAGQYAAGQRDDYKKEDADKENVVGNGNLGNAQKEFHNRHEGHQDDQVVGGHLDHCVCRISVGESAPHEYHGRAGCGAQKDGTGQVLSGQLRIHEGAKQVEEEKGGNAVHGEGLNEPVRYPGHQKAFPISSSLFDTLEIDFNHHGVNHNPDEHCHGKRNAIYLQAPQKAGQGGKEMAQGHAQCHAQQHPQGEIALEETHISSCISSRHDGHLLCLLPETDPE